MKCDSIVLAGSTEYALSSHSLTGGMDGGAGSKQDLAAPSA